MDKHGSSSASIAEINREGPKVDSEPSSAHVHVLVADLGSAAVHAEGCDGEQYCIVDSAVLTDDEEAREAAREVFLKACRRARRPAAFARS